MAMKFFSMVLRAKKGGVVQCHRKSSFLPQLDPQIPLEGTFDDQNPKNLRHFAPFVRKILPEKITLSGHLKKGVLTIFQESNLRGRQT